MADSHMPRDSSTVAHHLPPEQPVGPQGGRPRVGHRVVVRGDLFVDPARWRTSRRNSVFLEDRPPPAPGVGGGRNPGTVFHAELLRLSGKAGRTRRRSSTA